MLHRLVNRGLRRIGLALLPAPPAAELLVGHVAEFDTYSGGVSYNQVDEWLMDVARLGDRDALGWPRRTMRDDLAAISAMLRSRYAARGDSTGSFDDDPARLYETFERRTREQR